MDFCNTNSIRGHLLASAVIPRLRISDRLGTRCFVKRKFLIPDAKRRAALHFHANTGRDSPSRGLIPWIAHWETEPRLEQSRVLHCRPCARARYGNRVAPSLEFRTDQDSSATFFREEMNALRRIEALSVVTVFPHCVAITRHAGRTGLVPRNAPFGAYVPSAHAFATLRPLV